MWNQWNFYCNKIENNIYSNSDTGKQSKKKFNENIGCFSSLSLIIIWICFWIVHVLLPDYCWRLHFNLFDWRRNGNSSSYNIGNGRCRIRVQIGSFSDLQTKLINEYRISRWVFFWCFKIILEVVTWFSAYTIESHFMQHIFYNPF